MKILTGLPSWVSNFCFLFPGGACSSCRTFFPKEAMVANCRRIVLHVHNLSSETSFSPYLFSNCGVSVGEEKVSAVFRLNQSKTLEMLTQNWNKKSLKYCHNSKFFKTVRGQKCSKLCYSSMCNLFLERSRQASHWWELHFSFCSEKSCLQITCGCQNVSNSRYVAHRER